MQHNGVPEELLGERGAAAFKSASSLQVVDVDGARTLKHIQAKSAQRSQHQRRTHIVFSLLSRTANK